METIGHHHVQNGSFSRSNDPTASNRTPFWRFSCVIIHHFFGDLEFRDHFSQMFTWNSIKTYLWNWLVTTKMTHFQGQTSPRAGKPPIVSIFVAIVHMIFCYLEFFVKNLHGCLLRPYLWSQMVTTTKKGSFSRSNDPKAVNSLFYWFSCAIVHYHFLWSGILRSFLPKNCMDVR